MRRHSSLAVATVVCLLVSSAQAADEIPQPLTLEQALAFADEPHPLLATADAGVDAARADLARVQAGNGIYASVELTPQWVVPSVSADRAWVDDRRARATVNKTLYDFGRLSARERSAALNLDARLQNYLDVRAQRRLDIMARFFDVLLADLRANVDEETVALNYVQFDQARDRRRIGQISDVTLLEFENRFQESRIARAEAQSRRSSARLQLGAALNHPGVLPADLTPPKLTDLNKPAPEFKSLFELALKQNPRIVALHRDVESAQAAIEGERARRRPVVIAEFETTYYEREFLSRDDRRATLSLRMPLYQGGDETAAIAQAHARLREARGASCAGGDRSAANAMGSCSGTRNAQRESASGEGAFELSRALSGSQSRKLRARSAHRPW